MQARHLPSPLGFFGKRTNFKVNKKERKIPNIVEGVGQKSGPCTATFNDLSKYFYYFKCYSSFLDNPGRPTK
jgi:hypothetical protein